MRFFLNYLRTGFHCIMYSHQILTVNYKDGNKVVTCWECRYTKKHGIDLTARKPIESLKIQ
jgi:hypothetical protein